MIVTFVLPFHYAIAQSTPPPKLPTALVKGTVSDSTEKKSLSGGVVMILQKSDSIIIRHTRTDKSGNFQLKDIPSGNYLLLVTYPAYADYVDELEIKDSLPHIVPPIGLVLKSKLLEAVVVSGNKAIRMKGDTVEFRADSFHTQAGATVEDLLKKLPGIQVDSKGQITAQGQTVKKVLVDGEEFFGDDPTLVTQNLRADMVDKVQLYDKKSEQSNFTGIDDGQRDKTINLKLKDNKKNGYFGKLSAGQGTDGYYDYQAMFNYFKRKEKISGYGILSNTGKTGLNWQERDNYGQSFAGNLDYDETTGSFNYNGVNNDFESWDGKYNGQGIPIVKTGGLHYNNKWDDDRQSINGNYKVMQLDVNNLASTNSKNILPDSFYFNNEVQHSLDHILRHSMDGSYEIKFDSTSTLKLAANGGVDHKTTYSDFVSESLASDSSLVNRNTRNVSTVGDNRAVNSDLLWRKKLPKKGRTISLNVRENYTNNSSTGILGSTTGYYEQGVLTRDSVVDQHKDFHTENVVLDTKLTYTEPLSKVSFLIATYSLYLDNSHSNRNSYNKDAGGKYTSLDSLYSNDYQFNVLTNTGGLNYSLITKKWRVSAGSGIGSSRYNQRDLHADTSTIRKFINWYPNASVNYAFNPQKRLEFRYNGRMNQPNLNQLQPIRTNDDPLNIVVGNPSLKPEFRHQFNMYYNDFKILTERGIWMNASYNFTQNALSSASNIDTTGKRTTQTINVDGNHSFYSYMSYNVKLKKLNMYAGVYANFNLNSTTSVINYQKNTTNDNNYSFGFNIYKSKEKKYDFSIQPSATYTDSRSSINTQTVTKYWTYSIQPNLNIYLPLKFFINADAAINLRPKSTVFTNNFNNTLLNGSIGKKFLKNDALVIKMSANDLLNQNIGFNRNTYSNFISQNTYSTIKRYFMLTAVWNFTKAGTPAPNNR
jgi:hypothetical protein